MYKKFSIKTLSIVFSVLLFLVIFTEIIENSKGTNTLRDKLFSIDKNEISALKIYPRMLKGKEVVLKKAGENWQVNYQGKNYNADTVQIKSLINQLVELKPLRYAGKTDELQKRYELSDSLCSKLVLLDKNDNNLAALRIGRFAFLQNRRLQQQNPYMQQPQGTMITYVRLENEKDIFAVEGFLSMSVNQEADNFRNRKLLLLDKEKIKEIHFEYPADSSFVLQQKDKLWQINGSRADSASVATYLYEISNVTGSNFSKKDLANATYRLKIITLDNKNYVLSASFVDSTKVLLTSSQNKGTVFEENLEQNFKNLFKPKSNFLNKQ